MAMDRFERHRGIAGWDQARLSEACVGIAGWTAGAIFVSWSLAAMGIGRIIHAGAPHGPMQAFRDWFLAEPSPFPGTTIVDYPLDLQWCDEVAFAFRDEPNLLVCFSENPEEYEYCAHYAAQRGIPLLSGAAGGWLGPGLPPAGIALCGHPVGQAITAATLADEVRESLMPIWHRTGPFTAAQLPFSTPDLCRPAGRAVLVGAGGIGVYLAFLAVMCGFELVVIDFDTVSPSNLNRQGLFSPDDAASGAFKAEATRRRLREVFPHARISAHVDRVDRQYEPKIRDLNPDVLLCATDNAASRLALQSLGRSLVLPTVLGATDAHGCDVYVQEVGGPSLDDQSFGAISRAAKNEASRNRRRGCDATPIFVTPGLLAGALMAHRLVQIREGYRGLLPIRWRGGGGIAVQQQRSLDDGFAFTDEFVQDVC